MMKKRLILLLTSLAGVCNGLWMLILHVRYDKLGGVCSVSEKISCDVLTFKQYSVWWGIPTPVYALFLFLVLSILSFRGWKKIGQNRIREDAYALILSSVALIAAISMAYISFFILKRLCVFCFLFYVIIVISWITSKLILKDEGVGMSAALKNTLNGIFKDQFVWLGVVAFCCVIVFSHFAFQQTSKLSDVEITIKGDDMKTTGNPNAKVTMVVFSDFQCPSCKQAAGLIRELENSDYGNKVKIVYKFFPLNPECNSGAPYGQHLMACDAARAAVCAGQQQKFWRYHDKLFESQQSLYERKYYELAEDENLDMEKFESCFKSSASLDEVKKDTDEGAKIPIMATPTFFFNGKKFEGRVTVEDLKKMIDSF